MQLITDTEFQGRRVVVEAEDTLLSDPADDRIQVLGHRGAPAAGIAENSVAAVSRALDQGADGVEIDVWLVGDGTLVCAHDLAGADVTSLATLPDLLAAAQRPTGARVVVEAKPVADATVARATADALAAVLQTSAGCADITISSFDADLLATIRATCADLPVRTALLGEKADPADDVVGRAHRDGHDEVHLSVDAVRRSPLAVTTARWLGLSVALWTVNDREGLSWAAELGVDAVITDDVLVARDELDRAADAVPAAA
ncbi:MAG TPA: glycerophosphodiester phosphodiesterase [Blastococcus sp.]|jgi:glycerophosphoryl diester phosphodiesterase|nr:glycerophosphodiester phosphodiesterase [Blastococcus sp.]